MAEQPVGTDREILTQQAYATDEKLSVRYRTHELYTVPKYDFQAWVLDQISWRGDEWVLDVGAGSGSYFAALKARIPQGRHFAGDLSYGMVQRQKQQESAPGSYLTSLDAQSIPYADDTFDVVLANHMLYHVPDRNRCLAEIKRVLKPSGILIAATNSQNNMPEMSALFRRAILLLSNFEARPDEMLSVSRNFSLENGAAQLGRHFYAVARHDLPSALVFPEPKPVVEYIASLRDLREPSLPEGITWENFMTSVEQQVTRLIRIAGSMVVKKLAGVFVATDAGGFAHDYVDQIK